jgi:hypothetical protein
MRHPDVRRALPADAAAVTSVIERAIGVAAAGAYPADAVEALATGRTVEAVRAMIEVTDCFVATVGDAVVGWANLDGTEIDQLYGDPDAGGQGVARRTNPSDTSVADRDAPQVFAGSMGLVQRSPGTTRFSSGSHPTKDTVIPACNRVTSALWSLQPHHQVVVVVQAPQLNSRSLASARPMPAHKPLQDEWTRQQQQVQSTGKSSEVAAWPLTSSSTGRNTAPGTGTWSSPSSRRSAMKRWPSTCPAMTTALACRSTPMWWSPLRDRGMA